MQILGVELKQPDFWAATQSVGLAVVLWAVLTASPFGATTAAGAAANLAAIVFGCLSNAAGVDVRKGGRHMTLNILGCVLVLIAFRGIAALLTS
jgi:hypothetical protein